MTQPIDLDAVAVGRAVKGTLTEAGLTQADAAPLLGLSLQTLSRRINGSLPFTWPELVRVSGVTGVSLSDLAVKAERIRGQVSAA